MSLIRASDLNGACDDKIITSTKLKMVKHPVKIILLDVYQKTILIMTLYHSSQKHYDPLTDYEIMRYISYFRRSRGLVK